METILLTPPDKYINYIETSLHYMNDPKHMYNNDLHTVGRLQGMAAVVSFLKWSGCTSPIATAEHVMNKIVAIRLPEFEKINVNTYVGKDLKQLNLNCQTTHNKFEKLFAIEKDASDKRFGLGDYGKMYR